MAGLNPNRLPQSTAPATTSTEVMKPEEVMPPTIRADALAIMKEYDCQFVELGQTIASILAADPRKPLTTKMAHDTRMELVKLRNACDKRRKELTEDLHKRKASVDSEAKVIKDKIAAVEAKLQEVEDYEKIHLENRIRELSKARYISAEEAGVPPAILQGMDLGRMSEEAFQDVITAEIERKAAATRAAEEAKAKADAAAIENASIRKENEILNAQALARGAQYREERRLEELAAQQAREKLETERKAREAAEAKLAAQELAERQKREAAELAARRLAALPDKGKFLDFTDDILALIDKVPQAVSKDGKALQALLKDQISKIATWAAKQAENL